MRLVIGYLGDTSVLRPYRVEMFGVFGIFAGIILLILGYMHSYIHMIIGAIIFGICGGDTCLSICSDMYSFKPFL